VEAVHINMTNLTQRYTPEHNDLIELGYKTNKPFVELSLGGSPYRVNFVHMVQYNVRDPHKQRKLRRSEVQRIFRFSPFRQW
jgi:hypothetical protein